MGVLADGEWLEVGCKMEHQSVSGRQVISPNMDHRPALWLATKACAATEDLKNRELRMYHSFLRWSDRVACLALPDNLFWVIIPTCSLRNKT